MDMSAINFLAVLVAALVGFVVGFPWYGPVFGKAWMAETGITEEQAAKGNMPLIFGCSFVFQLIMSFCLAMFFYGDPTAADMINAGADDDTVFAGAGDDWVVGGGGDDQLIGGPGEDTAEHRELQRVRISARIVSHL